MKPTAERRRHLLKKGSVVFGSLIVIMGLSYSSFCLKRPAGTVQGLAGDHQFIKAGQMVAETNPIALYPRTVVALDKAGETLWMIVVDGRQFGYSEGITLSELAAVLVARGAHQALNLDGSGSTTLAIEDRGRPTVLNSPIHARIPTNLRPVVNHLGIYADDVSK